MNRIVTSSLLAALATLFTLSSGCGSTSNPQVRIRSAVNAQNSALSACYADALANDPDVEGDIQVALTVDEEGQVDDVNVGDTNIVDEEMPICVASALSDIEMSRPPEAAARISYTLRFTPSN